MVIQSDVLSKQLEAIKQISIDLNTHVKTVKELNSSEISGLAPMILEGMNGLATKNDNHWNRLLNDDFQLPVKIAKNRSRHRLLKRRKMAMTPQSSNGIEQDNSPAIVKPSISSTEASTSFQIVDTNKKRLSLKSDKDSSTSAPREFNFSSNDKDLELNPLPILQTNVVPLHDVTDDSRKSTFAENVSDSVNKP
jgi:hypothetical protein